MTILSPEASKRVEAAINTLADLACPVVAKDWKTATRRMCFFLVVAFIAIGLHRITGSVTPVFMVGWAWGMLGMYGIMRQR